MTFGEMHDRLIAATALHLSAVGDPLALITKDGPLTDSGIVPIVW